MAVNTKFHKECGFSQMDVRLLACQTKVTRNYFGYLFMPYLTTLSTAQTVTAASH
jgi:hypothetical protein